MSGLEIASLALGGISTGLTIMGQQQQAKAQQSALNRQAQAAEIEAGQKRAAAQKQAAEERRQARIASSNLQASAAASGMSASDIGTINLEQDIAGEGTYRSLLRLYEGEQAAQNLESQAAEYRYQGKAARTNANWASAATLMQFGSSSLDKYSSKKQSGTYQTIGSTDEEWSSFLKRN